MVDEQTIRNLIHSAGLDEFEAGIMKLVKPSIGMCVEPTNESSLDIGISRFGGSPDLPETIRWPIWREYFVPFWCQLNLSDIAAFDVEGVLPKSGMLYFFSVMGLDDAWAWSRGFDPGDTSGWKVIYYDGDVSKLRRETMPAQIPEECRIPSCSVEFRQQLSTPYAGDSTRQIRSLGLTETQEDSYVWKVHFELDDIYDDVDAPKIFSHQILGWPGTVQTDLSSGAEIGSEGLTWETPIETNKLNNWRLLFELDGDDEIMHSVFVYFMIRQTDLIAGNFDTVWCEEQSD